MTLSFHIKNEFSIFSIEYVSLLINQSYGIEILPD